MAKIWGRDNVKNIKIHVWVKNTKTQVKISEFRRQKQNFYYFHMPKRAAGPFPHVIPPGRPCTFLLSAACCSFNVKMWLRCNARGEKLVVLRLWNHCNPWIIETAAAAKQVFPKLHNPFSWPTNLRACRHVFCLCIKYLRPQKATNRHLFCFALTPVFHLNLNIRSIFCHNCQVHILRIET